MRSMSTWHHLAGAHTKQGCNRSCRHPSMFTLLSQRRLRFFGHVCRVEDGPIPKDVLYGELASDAKRVGCPALWFRDACKLDVIFAQVGIKSWESAAADRNNWRQVVRSGTRRTKNRTVNGDERKTVDYYVLVSNSLLL